MDQGDRIGLGFAGPGPPGALDSGAFHYGATAETPEQRILYDGDTGRLLYAADGSETPHAQRIAHRAEGLLHLDAGDVFVL